MAGAQGPGARATTALLPVGFMGARTAGAEAGMGHVPFVCWRAVFGCQRGTFGLRGRMEERVMEERVVEEGVMAAEGDSAAEVAMAAVLDHLGVLDEAAKKAMAAFLQAEVTNAKGDAVGTMRMNPGWTD